MFLGDSLTEGVGSKRISHVGELAAQLRAESDANVHEFRLRHISFNGQIDFNVAGLMNIDREKNPFDLWLWNLACEGQTIDSDLQWLPLISSLQPELIVIFRGSLESIIRPAMLPWWVPRTWRGYAAMDPRCYFSNTWWRKAKQTAIDEIKQRVRLKLLKLRAGKPLMDLEVLATHQTDLLRRLQGVTKRVVVLGLLPVDDARFPGSAEYFKLVNARLRQVAVAEGAEFLDWGSLLKADNLFYRDGFHPNGAGARALAGILRSRLCKEQEL